VSVNGLLVIGAGYYKSIFIYRIREATIVSSSTSRRSAIF
jgi:hypothetical protein